MKLSRGRDAISSAEPAVFPQSLFAGSPPRIPRSKNLLNKYPRRMTLPAGTIMKKIAIIGGGASGRMAACFAAGKGRHVTVFEKQKKTGRKLLATGNGRCNITNTGIDVSRYHGGNPAIVRNIFSRFGLDETVDFFESIGLPLVEKAGGRLYPASLQASSVQRILEHEASSRGAEILLHRKAERLIPGKHGIRLITAGQESFDFDSVILAVGSCAYPQLGASRDVYDLARALGHTVREPLPSIVPLTIPLKILHRLEGIKWDCALSVRIDGKTVSSSQGELLFTSYGISGPVSLDASRAVNAGLAAGRAPEIIVDLFPEKTEEELASLVARLWSDSGKTAAFALAGILKERMPEVLLSIAGIDPQKSASTVTAKEAQAAVRAMKSLTLDPGDPRPFSEAVVAAGGIDTDGINPATMESRVVPGLFITGEVLDIVGESGGYNLQFAWSTGAVAGMAQA